MKWSLSQFIIPKCSNKLFTLWAILFWQFVRPNNTDGGQQKSQLQPGETYLSGEAAEDSHAALAHAYWTTFMTISHVYSRFFPSVCCFFYLSQTQP